VTFLGHSVSAAGCRPLPTKVIALQQHPRRTTVKGLQQFVGLVNFYRKFLPSAARVLAPLTDALRGSPAGSAELTWTPAMATAFTTIKAVLAASVALAHPSTSSPWPAMRRRRTLEQRFSNGGGVLTAGSPSVSFPKS